MGARIGLLNAMPTEAVASAGRQFAGLVGDRTVWRYRLPGLDGGRPAAPGHRPFAALFDDGLDALVVTGTEPPAGALEDAPYWDALAGVLTGVRDRRLPVWLSCLSAHAWLRLHDGLERRPLERKLSGVYAQDRPPAHPLVAGLGSVAVPHSRHNEVLGADLAGAGYRVLLAGPACGWSLAVADDDARTVLVQGHPEYAPETLLREYRRDLARFRDGIVPALPAPPVDYLSPAGADVLADHVARVAAGDRRPFPFRQLAAGLRPAWATTATSLVEAWLRPVEALAHA